MKTLLVIASIALSGCAHQLAILQAHQAEVVVIGATAGAVAATEQAVVGAIQIGKEVSRE